MNNLFAFLISILISIPLISQVEQKVIIEHFTNSRCGICAAKNPAFYTTLENYPDVLHIAYHPSSPYPSCIFSQHNPAENDNRAYYYGVYGATPRVVVNGDVIPAQTPLINPEQIDAHLNQTSDYSMTVTNEQISGNNYKVTLNIKRESGTDWETVLLFAGLAEKLVQYDAPNGENLHRDVFRKRVFYDTVSINPAGNSKTMEFYYTSDPVWVQPEIYTYAIIHDMNTQAVKQSASSLDTPSGIANQQIVQLNNVVYPNPTLGKLSIKSEFLEKFVRVEVFSFLGNSIAVYENLNSIDLSGQAAGLYFFIFTDNEGKRYTARVVRS